MICLSRPWVERLPIPNWTVPRRRKGVMIQAASVLFSLTHGIITTFTSSQCLMTICLLHWAVCGFPFATMIPKSLGLLWLPLFPTLIFSKGPHYPCASPFNLGRVFNQVGKSGWTRRCPMCVLWRAVQQVGVLKAIVSFQCLSNYRDLFNLRHLVRRWCNTTHTFFLSCSEITVTLE